jgi:hypothetical protein
VVIDGSTEFPYVGDGETAVVTTLTFVVVDSTGLESTCDVTVTINDDESPTLEDCGGLDVVGVTDNGESYGTTGLGDRVPLVYPTVSDNSGEEVLVTASVSGAGVAETPELQCLANGGVFTADSSQVVFCCAGSCGSCGGSGCADRPGGGANCCIGTVRVPESV